MGVVYLGQDPDGYRVAVKLLRPHVVSDDSGRARMAREVTSLRRVRSALVAEVYDADPWGQTPYLVTRYVPGPSLHDRVEKAGPLSGPELEAVAAGLAQALVAVHAADVLHRDVKPSNVLLDGATPILIDFGLAQLADDSRLTHSGWLLGTPGYLAPEILFGGDPTPFADVHSWAATVVYAATGRGPYGNGPAVAVMDRVRRAEHDLSGVPDSLSWVIRRALSADPRDRPTSWQLSDWLAGGPLGASRSASGAPVTAVVSAEPTPVGAMSMPPPAPPSFVPVQPWGPPVAASPGLAQPRGRPGEAIAVQNRPWSRAAAAVPVPARPWNPAPPSSPAANPRAWTDTGVPRSAEAAVTALFWMSIGCLLMAGAVAAPGLAAAVLVASSWLLRTVSVRGDRLSRWRRRRGPRRGDTILATVCAPWFALLALPGAVVNAGIALVSGAAVVGAATLALPPRTLVYVLAVGSVVAGAFVSWGPFSCDVRAGSRVVSSALLRPGLTSLLVLLAIVAAAAAVLLVRQVAGPVYAPFPSPPWQHSLRQLVPHE